MTQNIPYAVFFVLFQLIIREKPETPPSAVAAAPPSELTFWESFRVMWANKNFMVLALSYALIYGVYCAIGTTMSNLLNPFGYTPTEISVAGGFCLFAGVIGALLVGCYLDCTAYYRRTHATLSIMTFISCLVTIVTLKLGSGSLGEIMFAIILVGISSVSFFPTSLSYGAELTFPLQPALVNACMNFLGQICAFVLMISSIYITDVDAAHLDT